MTTTEQTLTVGSHVTYRRHGETHHGDVLSVVEGEKYGVLVKGINGKTYLLSEEKVRAAEALTEGELAEIKEIGQMVEDLKTTALGRHYTSSGLRQIAREMHAAGWANDKA